MRVIICGGGVIGAAVGYYLTLAGVRPLIIERDEVAAGASGKAGGFLALDWCDGSPLAPMARASFALHAMLGGEAWADWGYRRVRTLAVAAWASGESGGGAGWLDGQCAVRGELGGEETTAQVDPARFTRGLIDAALARGASLRAGCVGRVRLTAGPPARVTGVEVDGEHVEADVVVVAMGPWSMRLADSLPVPPVFGYKGQSLVLRPRDPVPADALFVEYRDERGQTHSPEVYPRADGTVYVSGMSDDPPLPERAHDVAPDPASLARLEHAAAGLSSRLRGAEVVARQACYRPIAPDGLPLLGPAPGVDGAFLATGHSCWGILNAPASGAALADLIVRGDCDWLDLAPYDPARFAGASSRGFG